MTYVPIQKAFTKGFVGGFNQVKTPPIYSNYLRNARLENDSILPRPGYRNNATLGNLQGWFIKGISVKDIIYALVVRPDNHLHLYRIHYGGRVDTGIVGDKAAYDNPNTCDIVAVGDFILIVSFPNDIYRYHPTLNPTPSPIDWTDRPSQDGRIDPEPLRYDSTHGFSSNIAAYYSGFIFINEIQGDNPTNRLILSHEINLDTKQRENNAKNFSQRLDSDDNKIPYKLICDSTIRSLVPTQQNLYIFCDQTVQYIDKNILLEYAQNKTLRALPLGDGGALINKRLCVSANNFVFFMSEDLHIRTIGYTSGIYDPNIADITDTEFGIQKWIDDNIDPDQDEGFAFFNKEQMLVEFHLKKKGAGVAFPNEIVLIRDLHHQTWLIDEGHPPMTYKVNHKMSWTFQIPNPPWPPYFPNWDETEGSATIQCFGTDHYCYYEYKGRYDSDRYGDIRAIEFEYNTVNIALGETGKWKNFRGITLTWAINIHTGNEIYNPDPDPALFEIVVWIDGKDVARKKVSINDIIFDYQRLQAEVGGPLLPPYNPSDPDIVRQYENVLFPVDITLDKGMVRRKGKRLRVQILAETAGNVFYFSGLEIEALPVGNFDLSDKF